MLHDSREPGCEKYVDGPEPLPLDDEKSVHGRVENARFDLRSKLYAKPAADHPWNTRRTQSMSPVKPPKSPRKKADLSCSGVKFCLCVSGGFSGGLLPFLPVIRQKNRQLVLAVRTIRTLWVYLICNGRWLLRANNGRSQLANAYKLFPSHIR